MSEATLAEETQAVEPATQASPVTESNPDNLDEALALLDEIEGKATQDETRTEPTAPSTEPEADPDELAAVKAAREAAAEEARAAQREEDEKAQADRAERELRQRQLEGIDQSFRQRTQAIRAWGKEVLEGSREVTQQDIDALAEMLNQHHAQASLVTNKDYWDGTVAYAKAVLPEGAAKEIADAAGKGQYRTFRNLMDAIFDAKVKDASTGHYSEAQVKEREALATLKALRKFTADPDKYLSRKNTAASRSNGAPVRAPSSPDQMSREQVNEMLAKAGV